MIETSGYNHEWVQCINYLMENSEMKVLIDKRNSKTSEYMLCSISNYILHK